MIELWVDEVRCDLDTEATIVLSYDVESMMSDLEMMARGVEVVVELPASVVNDEVLANDGYIHAPKRFNSEEHRAVVKCDGETLLEGVAHLDEVEWRSGRMYYKLAVRAKRAEWASVAAKSVFKDMEVELDMKLAANRIREQWESDDPVKFVAVRRDTYKPIQSLVSNESVREVVALEDYSPFLNIDAMMRSIFESNGYRVESRFMDSDYFKSLYMNGSFGSSTNSEQTVNAMDFMVRRYNDCTVEADYSGCVYMSPHYAANSVGMVVDPDTTNTERDCFSNGRCFEDCDGVPAFRPLVAVSVGFAVRLNYITPYKIESRTKLKAFDKVHLCVGHDYEFDVVNRFEDLKGELLSDFSYMLCVFDYSPSDDVSIYFRLADGSLRYYGELGARVTYVTTPVAQIEELVLMYNLGDGEQEPYVKDWAMYNGYVQESGTTQVDVTLRITPREVTPTSPMLFDEIYIEGGEPGWEFKLLRSSCITPYFYKHPGVNALVSFADIARHDRRQSELVEAVAHLFNLRFWTDDVNRVVYVEPYDDMWSRDKVWDWSDKIDWQKPIEVSDLAAEVFNHRRWGYQDDDGVTSRRRDEVPSDEFGFWEYELDSSVARDTSTKTLLSPLFSPTRHGNDMLLQVGDRDDLDYVNSLNFSPRIVQHKGHILYENGRMPYMSFYDPSNGVSFCFEDRGGVEGLNRFYRGRLEQEKRGRVVTLWMKLTAADVASLMTLGEVTPDVRSIFGLDLGGDYARCILKEVVEYNPQKGSTKCRFIIID